MNTIYLYIIVTVLIAGALGFLGALLLLWKAEVAKKISRVLLSFAVGAMLGVVFFDLLPESFEIAGEGKAGIFVLVGILAFFVIEKFLIWNHCHTHGIEHSGHCEIDRLHSSKYLVIVGDFFHNFIDGVIVATSFLVSIPLGIAAAVAEIAHEIPQEIGDFSIMIAGGMKRAQVLFWNLVSEAGSLLGAILVIFLHTRVEGLVTYMLPIAAGGFLYIAMADLIPELHHETRIKHSIGHIALFVFGLVILYSLGEVLGHG